VGCIYGLVGIGFCVIYNASGIVNFAQGAFVMMGGMIAYGAFKSLGLPLEDRAFHPHLTLGRWRQARPSDRPSLAAAAHSTGAMRVDHVTLYESRLSSEGPTHIARASARLEPPEPLEPLEPWHQ